MMRFNCPICDSLVASERMNDHLDSNCTRFTQMKDTKLPKVIEGPRDAPSAIINKKSVFVPLAEASRPQMWDEIKGQSMLDNLCMIKTLSSNDKLPSIILWVIHH